MDSYYEPYPLLFREPATGGREAQGQDSTAKGHEIQARMSSTQLSFACARQEFGD